MTYNTPIGSEGILKGEKMLSDLDSFLLPEDYIML